MPQLAKALARFAGGVRPVAVGEEGRHDGVLNAARTAPGAGDLAAAIAMAVGYGGNTQTMEASQLAQSGKDETGSATV